MTLQEIIDKVKKIEDCAGDDEAAHSMECDLWEAVLSDIANGCSNPVGYAKEALKTKNIKFARWCA